jgi:ketosteroid isomerase-like protein
VQERYLEFYSRFLPEPNPSITPVPSSPTTESPNPIPTISPAPNPKEIIPQSTPTEEEQKIRETLAYYANMWVKGDIARIISLYTDYAVLSILWLNTGSQRYEGKKSILNYYGGLSSGARLTWLPSSFKITDMEISKERDEATVSSQCLWMSIYGNLRVISTYQLVDLSRIKSYLKKGSWRISREITNVYRSG